MQEMGNRQNFPNNRTPDNASTYAYQQIRERKQRHRKENKQIYVYTRKHNM